MVPNRGPVNLYVQDESNQLQQNKKTLRMVVWSKKLAKMINPSLQNDRNQLHPTT